MQKFRTLAAFFLVEKQQPQREEEREIMPSTMVTMSSAQRRSDQNHEHFHGWSQNDSIKALAPGKK